MLVEMVVRLVATMAAHTVACTGSLMVEGGWDPGAGGMAGGALRRVVVGRFGTAVT